MAGTYTNTSDVSGRGAGPPGRSTSEVHQYHMCTTPNTQQADAASAARACARGARLQLLDLTTIVEK